MILNKLLLFCLLNSICFYLDLKKLKLTRKVKVKTVTTTKMPAKKFVKIGVESPFCRYTVYKVNVEIKLKRLLRTIAESQKFDMKNYKFVIDRTGKQVNPVLSAATQNLVDGEVVVVVQQSSSG